MNTIPAFLGHGIRGGRRVAAVAGIIVLLFLGTYAAGQLLAGGKALRYITGWNVEVGILIGAAIVVAYCFAGGIRASIWTDVAQSVVMIASMGLLLTVAVVEIGGFREMWARLEAIDPELTVLFPDYRFGFAGFLLGWMGAGLGVVGQPHIMLRAMAMDHPENMAKARRIYVSWYGVFAATISTADSQILSCSASVPHDVAPPLGQSYRAVKLATLGVAVLGWRIGRFAALATMLGGVAGSFAWYFAGFADDVYQVLPGMASGFAVYIVSRLFRPTDQPPAGTSKRI